MRVLFDADTQTRRRAGGKVKISRAPAATHEMVKQPAFLLAS
jgi:hypothetical protein